MGSVFHCLRTFICSFEGALANVKFSFYEVFLLPFPAPVLATTLSSGHGLAVVVKVGHWLQQQLEEAHCPAPLGAAASPALAAAAAAGQAESASAAYL